MKVSVPSALRNGYHSDSTTSSSGNESFSSSSSYASTSKRPTRADGRAIPSTSRSSSKLTSREREGAPASTDDDDDEDDDYISDETTFIPQDEDRTPRKVIRRKTQLCECIECALLITINDKGDSTIHSDIKRSERGTRGSHARNAGSRATERPWSRLVEIRQAMSKDKQKGKDTEPEASCSEQLQRMLDEEVIPLTMDKAYLARLSGAEARAARSFRSDQGPRGASASRRSNSQADRLLSTVHPIVVLRLSRFALAHDATRPTYLDLSHLPYPDNKAFLEGLDLEWLFSLVGCSPESVTHLDLSSNGLDEFPFWPSFPFHEIQVINLTSNPHLSSLPFRLVRLPFIRRIQHRHTKLSHDGAATFFGGNYQPDQPIRFPHTKARTVPSLVDLTLLAVHRTRRSLHPDEYRLWMEDAKEELPPHLVGKIVSSFICDKCSVFDIPPLVSSRVPVNPNHVVGWQVRNDPKGIRTPAVRVNVRSCNSCAKQIASLDAKS